MVPSHIQPGSRPSLGGDWTPGYSVAEALVARLQAAVKGLVLEPLPSAVGAGPRTPTVHFGAILTGDSFVNSERTRRRLRERFAAHAVEMEGGAVAQVARRWGDDIPGRQRPLPQRPGRRREPSRFPRLPAGRRALRFAGRPPAGAGHLKLLSPWQRLASAAWQCLSTGWTDEQRNCVGSGLSSRTLRAVGYGVTACEDAVDPSKSDLRRQILGLRLQGVDVSELDAVLPNMERAIGVFGSTRLASSTRRAHRFERRHHRGRSRRPSGAVIKAYSSAGRSRPGRGWAAFA